MVARASAVATVSRRDAMNAPLASLWAVMRAGHHRLPPVLHRPPRSVRRRALRVLRPGMTPAHSHAAELSLPGRHAERPSDRVGGARRRRSAARWAAMRTRRASGTRCAVATVYTELSHTAPIFVRRRCRAGGGAHVHVAPRRAEVRRHGCELDAARPDPVAREFIALWMTEDRVVAGMNVNVWDVTDRFSA